MRPPQDRVVPRATNPETGEDDHLPTGDWELPAEIEIVGDRLVWSVGYGGGRTRPRARMLEDFAALGTFDVEDVNPILRFARRYGPLRLCSHELPDFHFPDRFSPPPRGEMHCRPRFTDSSERYYFEPLESWRRWSRRVRATQSLWTALQKGWDLSDRLPDADAMMWPRWRAKQLVEFRPGKWNFIAESAVSAERTPYLGSMLSMIAGQATDISFQAGVLLFLNARKGKPYPELAGRTVLGALGIDLIAAMSGVRSIDWCAGCTKQFTVTRKRRADSRRYCSSCAKREAQNRASTTYYQLNREQILAARRERRSRPSPSSATSKN
jgi:hypothetical protein